MAEVSLSKGKWNGNQGEAGEASAELEHGGFGDFRMAIETAVTTAESERS